LKTFTEVADSFKVLEKLISFGILDGLANEFEDFENVTYPSILLFKKGYFYNFSFLLKKKFNNF